MFWSFACANDQKIAKLALPCYSVHQAAIKTQCMLPALHAEKIQERVSKECWILFAPQTLPVEDAMTASHPDYVSTTRKD